MTFTVQLIDCMYLPNTGHLTPHDTGTITMGTLIMQRAPPTAKPLTQGRGVQGYVTIEAATDDGLGYKVRDWLAGMRK